MIAPVPVTCVVQALETMRAVLGLGGAGDPWASRAVGGVSTAWSGIGSRPTKTAGQAGGIEDAGDLADDLGRAGGRKASRTPSENDWDAARPRVGNGPTARAAGEPDDQDRLGGAEEPAGEPVGAGEDAPASRPASARPDRPEPTRLADDHGADDRAEHDRARGGWARADGGGHQPRGEVEHQDEPGHARRRCRRSGAGRPVRTPR